MKEGNRPYSITYQISYALSNTHHSELFIRNEFIEIPEIFGKVAQAIYPERVEFPLIPETDIQIQDKPILQRNQSIRLESRRLSFQGDRITSYRWDKKPVIETQQELKSFSTIGKLICPEGWKQVEIVFDITKQRNQFPCNTIYYLEQPTIGTYQGLINIGELEVHIQGIPGKESDRLILGLEFLEEHKPWKLLELETLENPMATSPFSIYISVGMLYEQYKIEYFADYIDSGAGICTAKRGVFPNNLE